MKGRIAVLLFALVVCCLMCLPFIVSSEASEQPPEPPRAFAREQAVMTGTTHTSRIPDIKKGDTVRPVSVKPEAVEAAQVCPVSDANGLPILRISYLRSNYQAFCLTGNGG